MKWLFLGHSSGIFASCSLLYRGNWSCRYPAPALSPSLPFTFIFHKWTSLGIAILWPTGETHTFLGLARGLFEFHWNTMKEKRGIWFFFSPCHLLLHPSSPSSPTHTHYHSPWFVQLNLAVLIPVVTSLLFANCMCFVSLFLPFLLSLLPSLKFYTGIIV